MNTRNPVLLSKTSCSTDSLHDLFCGGVCRVVSKFNDFLGTQDTKGSQVPQEHQVTEVGQDTEAIEDTKVSQVPQVRQVTEVGQDTEAIEDTKVSQVPQERQVTEVGQDTKVR